MNLDYTGNLPRQNNKEKTKASQAWRREYDQDHQTFFLEAIITRPDIYDRCRHIIKAEYFDRILRSTAKYIFECLDENVVPIPEQIRAVNDMKIDHIKSPIDDGVADNILKQIEGFCRNKEESSLFLDGIDLLNNGDYLAIEEWAKQVNAISLKPDVGYSCRKDFSMLLRQSIDDSVISSGWNSVDDILYGGFQRNGLTLFGGQSGGGKSNCLINLALNWQSMGLNVAYVTLEMPERVINQRWAAMVTGMSTSEIRFDIGKAELKIATKLKGGYGDIFYIKMPEGNTSVNEIRAYVRNLISCHGRAPDALICDYLDLLCPSKRMDMSNLFVKDKYVSEELRALAFEFNMAVATASQLNRGSYGEGSFDLAHTAGGMSKINTADDVIFVKSTPEMRQKGQMEFQFMKTRNSAGVGKVLEMKYDATCMRISDAEPKPDVVTRNPVIGKLLKNKGK